MLKSAQSRHVAVVHQIADEDNDRQIGQDEQALKHLFNFRSLYLAQTYRRGDRMPRSDSP